MRLDDFDPNINVGSQDNRGGGFGGGGGGGGLLFGLLPLIGSRFGCGGIVVVLILMAVFSGGLGGILGGGSTTAPQTRSAPAGGGNATQICSADPARRAACNAFSSAEHTWEKLMPGRFQAPSLQFFDQNGQSGCGAAQAAMGPFYCPTDQGIYLDTSFFNELTNRFHAAGDFAQYYVVAHEFGHHIQRLTGDSERVQQIQRSSGRTEGNAASVRLELQADCYAGVWAAQNRDRLEPGDIEEGMRAAQAIGDDTLQREAGGNVNQESFTHGSSAQRMKWLKVGLDSGDPAKCDTFSGTP
ncbi:neutral zinc metallopeptidase [Sphingomonas sp.]|uniref:KPN_02809 family neutral zinc metallopeptidase n=1 Tax=Sphingomonas sp. TaxID=28214 RepID=UPI003B00FFF7